MVVLPAPLGPSRANTSPGARRRRGRRARAGRRSAWRRPPPAPPAPAQAPLAPPPTLTLGSQSPWESPRITSAAPGAMVRCLAWTALLTAVGAVSGRCRRHRGGFRGPRPARASLPGGPGDLRDGSALPLLPRLRVAGGGRGRGGPGRGRGPPAWRAARGGSSWPGLVLFSGSLYPLALSGARWLGAVAPLGGVAFIAGWISLAGAAWRGAGRAAGRERLAPFGKEEPFRFNGRLTYRSALPSPNVRGRADGGKCGGRCPRTRGPAAGAGARQQYWSAGQAEIGGGYA